MVGKPRIAAEICIPPEKLHEWFCHALKNDDPKPSLDACEMLVREFQSILNAQNTEERERDPKLPPWYPMEISEEQIIEKLKARFMSLANQLLVESEELESRLGPCPWGLSAPSLYDIREPLLKVGVSPVPRVPRVPRDSLGRPREAWHAVASGIAWAIKNALKKEGYAGSLNAKDENSVVAIVGAKAISSAYKIKIEAAGFVAAMERRRRKGGKRVRTPMALEDIFQEFPAPTHVPDPPHILKR
jgi:hypothetical protein